MDLHVAAGVGGTITVGSKLLTVRQLSVGDVAALQKWVIDRLPRPFEIVTQALIDLQPLKELDPIGYEQSRLELIRGARDDSKLGKGVDPAQAMENCNGIEGIAYMLFLSTREHHPRLDYEAIKELLDKEDLEAIKTKLDDVNRAWMQQVLPDPPAIPTPAISA